MRLPVTVITALVALLAPAVTASAPASSVGDAALRAIGPAGSIQGVPWAGPRGTTQSISGIAARQRRQDRAGGRPRGIRERPEPGEGEVRPKLSGRSAPRLGRSAGAVAGPSAAVTAGSSFLGAQASESGFIPPDSMGSVGPTQVLVGVNGRIKLFDKLGNLGALNVTDATFWAPVANGADVSDPNVEYDRLSGRWILSAINLESTDNRIMIAVSSGATLTGSSDFTFFYFNHNTPSPAGDSGLFADYPQMAVDKNAIYVGVNDFSGSGFSRTSAFVIRKSSVLGPGPMVVSAFRGLAVGSGAGPFTPQPAQDMDPNVDEGYFIGVDNQVFNQLDIRRVSNPGGTPTMSGNLTVAVPATYFPLNVPAQGTHNSLDALDDRLFEAMIARKPDGSLSLWTAHNIRVDSTGTGGSGGNRTAARWYELANLATTPSLVQAGTLFDSAASSPRYFWIPSIAANGQGNVSLNASTAGSGRFAEIASTGRLASDPSGTLEPFSITQASSSEYDLGPGTVKRWGDYSQTAVDPTDNMTFWTFQEYANATDSWGVRALQLKAPAPATPTSASPSTVSGGSSSVSVAITGASSAGSAFFDPGPDTNGPGFANRIDASVSGGVAVNEVTYVDPTHVTLDLDTTAAPDGGKDVTITNPDGQSSSAVGLISVGADTTAPDTSITGGPANGSTITDSTPTFTFSSPDGTATFECKVDAGAYAACTSPFTTAVLADGSHTVSVRAKDPVGNTDPTPASRTFTVNTGSLVAPPSAAPVVAPAAAPPPLVRDLTAPQTTIVKRPRRRIRTRRPSFRFVASEPGAVFLCRFDMAPFRPCSSPFRPSRKLRRGKHVFSVLAIDPASNRDASPARTRFKIVR